VRKDPRVAVVVITHQRRDELLLAVDRLLALPEQPHVVVVDNGSTDGTSTVLGQRFPHVPCLRMDTNIGGAARNIGVMSLDRPYVALCDDDTWWTPDSLRSAADLLDGFPSVALVVARVLVGPENRVDPLCLELATSPVRSPQHLPGPAVVGFLAGASIVRRSPFLKVGGFEQRFFIGGEEELLALDLIDSGWELAYVDALTVHHHPSAQSRDPEHRRHAIIRNHLWVAWLRYPLRWALVDTLRAVCAARRDTAVRSALRAALRHAPWVVTHRRVVGDGLRRRLSAVRQNSDRRQV
jgi:GT2 family glycosyltransferase